MKKFGLLYIAWGNKRNPRCFDENIPEIKPGTRLVRIYQLFLSNSYLKEISEHPVRNRLCAIAGSRIEQKIF